MVWRGPLMPPPTTKHNCCLYIQHPPSPTPPTTAKWALPFSAQNGHLVIPLPNTKASRQSKKMPARVWVIFWMIISLGFSQGPSHFWGYIFGGHFWIFFVFGVKWRFLDGIFLGNFWVWMCIGWEARTAMPRKRKTFFPFLKITFFKKPLARIYGNCVDACWPPPSLIS